MTMNNLHQEIHLETEICEHLAPLKIGIMPLAMLSLTNKRGRYFPPL